MSIQLCKILGFDVMSHTFGRVFILAVGDLYHLPPVKPCPILKYLNRITCQTVMEPLLWHEFKFLEVIQIIRQKDSILFCLLGATQVTASDAGSAEDRILQSHEIKVSEDHPLYPKTSNACIC